MPSPDYHTRWTPRIAACRFLLLFVPIAKNVIQLKEAWLLLPATNALSAIRGPHFGSILLACVSVLNANSLTSFLIMESALPVEHYSIFLIIAPHRLSSVKSGDYTILSSRTRHDPFSSSSLSSATDFRMLISSGVSLKTVRITSAVIPCASKSNFSFRRPLFSALRTCASVNPNLFAICLRVTIPPPAPRPTRVQSVRSNPPKPDLSPHQLYPSPGSP